MVSCGMSTIKYMLFFFNFIFAISGIGIIAAGSLILAEVREFSHFLEGGMIVQSSVLIFAGVIVFIIAFLGCYGAIKEHYKMLIAFAVALVLIFVIEFGVGIAAAVFKNDLATVLKDQMKTSLTNDTQADQMAWETMQTRLQCCGVDHLKDWRNATKSTYARSDLLPSSCCKEVKPNEFCYSFKTDVNHKGCYAALEERVQQAATIIICVGMGIAFVEIAGIVLACSLAMAIRKEGGET